MTENLPTLVPVMLIEYLQDPSQYLRSTTGGGATYSSSWEEESPSI